MEEEEEEVSLVSEDHVSDERLLEYDDVDAAAFFRSSSEIGEEDQSCIRNTIKYLLFCRS